MSLIGWSYGNQEIVHKPQIVHTVNNIQPLSGEHTAELVATFYKELGPRLGSHLVEPNVVITLAGLRGSGNFSDS